VGPRTEVKQGRRFDTFEQHLIRNGDAGRTVVLKMDVEGAEWDSLLATSDETLSIIPQLAMELHGTDDRKVLDLVRKLKRNFYLANFHYNNWSCTWKAWPFKAWAYQVLWVNKRIAALDPSVPVPAPRSSLNAPDRPHAPDCQ
jgi:hypothetical protein